jgi:hypothetical protein
VGGRLGLFPTRRVEGELALVNDWLRRGAVSSGEIHAGAAVTVAAPANLWLRFQLADAVTAARSSGYAHCVEIGLGIVTRVGRRDRF